MKYILAFAVSVLILSGVYSGGNSVYAQGPPANDTIMYKIVNSESPYYYPALMMRYIDGDTTLTTEDYKYLYYGYPWQDTYKPFETAPGSDRLVDLFDKTPDFYNIDPKEIIDCCNQIMATEPFNPGTINMLIFAYAQLGDTVNERINYHRLDGVINAIKSTGTGLKENSAWHVLYFKHAIDMMGVLDLPHNAPTVVSRTVEYIPLIRARDKVKGYYFDYSRIYWFVPDKLPEREHPGWTINGIIPLGGKK